MLKRPGATLPRHQKSQSRTSGLHQEVPRFSFRSSDHGVPQSIMKRFVMATVENRVLSKADSIFDLGDRLAGLLQQIRERTVHDEIPESSLSRLADVVEALRSRLVRKAEHDPRSLFDLDQRLIELMDCAEEAAEQGEIPQDLLDEINDYLEAYQTKVDRIAGYWRWQESIATICGQEVERLSTRKRAAERRVVDRLKEMLLTFMLPRGLKR